MIQSLNLDPRIAFVGLVVGTLVGLSGVGGGSLVTPLLVLVLGVKPAVAIGTDLLYSVPTKLLGAAVHHRQKTVDWQLVRWLVTGGVPAAILGLLVLATAQTRFGVATVNDALKHAVGAMLLLVSVAIVLKPLLTRWTKAASQSDESVEWTRMEAVRVAALGALVGFLVSLTSIGSGSLTVPLLYFLVPRLNLRRLVGSDVAFGAILIPVAAAGHLQMGHVNISLAANLVIGSLPGVVIGSKLCAIVPTTYFRPALAVVLLFAGSRLI